MRVRDLFLFSACVLHICLHIVLSPAATCSHARPHYETHCPCSACVLRLIQSESEPDHDSQQQQRLVPPPSLSFCWQGFDSRTTVAFSVLIRLPSCRLFASFLLSLCPSLLHTFFLLFSLIEIFLSANCPPQTS